MNKTRRDDDQNNCQSIDRHSFVHFAWSLANLSAAGRLVRVVRVEQRDVIAFIHRKALCVDHTADLAQFDEEVSLMMRPISTIAIGNGTRQQSLAYTIGNTSSTDSMATIESSSARQPNE